MAWDDPVWNQTYIIVVNEALYYGTKLDHSLLNPNQIRHYGLNFWDNSYDKERGLNIKLDDSVEVTMRTKGTKIYFKKRSPGKVELRDCPKLQLTSRNEWNCTIVSLGELKSNTRDHLPMMRISQMKISPNTNDYEYLDSTDYAPLLHSVEPSLSNLKEQLLEKLPKNVA